MLEGANPNSNLARGDYGDNPLHLACRHGWLDIVRLLIEDKNSDPNVRDCGKQTPLHYASRYGHEDIVRYLILKGCDATVVDGSKWTPLHSACRYGHTSIAIYFIDFVGMDCEVRSSNSCTPLHLAALYCGSSETVKYLVSEKCCNVDAKDNTNRTPLDYACRSGNCEGVTCFVKELRCHTFSPEQCQKIAVCASKSGQIELLDEMVKAYGKLHIINSKDNQGSLLQHACRNGQLNVLKYFQPLTLAENRSALIIEACKGGYTHIVRYLVSECGCLAAINGSAVFHACKNNYADLIDYLVQVKGSVILNVTSHNTSCFQSISNIKIIKNLLNQGATPTLEVIFHWLFCSLAEVDALDLMKFLLTHNVWDPNKVNAGGYSALHLACITDRSLLASYLLTDCTIKVNPLAKSTSGESPLDLTRNLQIIRKLVECGATVGRQTVIRLLHENTDDSDIVNLIRYLGKCGHWNATVEEEDVLHLACQTNRLRVVRCLLDEAKCNPNVLNSRGETPLQLSSDIDIIKELVHHDARVLYPEVICLLMNISKEYFDDLYTLLTDDVHMNDAEILCLACKSDRVSVVHYLLTCRKCDPNISNAGESPLQSTANPEVIKVLLKQGAAIDGSDVLRWLTGTMDESSVLQVVQYLVNNNIWDSNEPVDLIDGDTILHLACESNQHSVVQYLLTRVSCNPNVTNNLGKTPIQLTSNLHIIKDLVNHGAQVNDSPNWWDNLI